MKYLFIVSVFFSGSLVFAQFARPAQSNGAWNSPQKQRQYSSNTKQYTNEHPPYSARHQGYCAPDASQQRLSRAFADEQRVIHSKGRVRNSYHN